MTATASQAAPAREHPVSFKALFLKGSFWSMAAHGAGQVVSLGGNVIVCRLLLPEVMGLMLLVNTVIIGLAMFSDIGLSANVIQSKRGEDPAFLRTAWMIAIGRGILLWLLSIPVSFVISRVVDEPRLVYLVPVVALTTVVSSFYSPALLLLRRRIHLGPLFLLNFTAQVLQVAVMVVLAYIFRSIWALVISAFVPVIYRVTASHTWMAGDFRMRFEWDRDAAREIFHFGMWLFFSSIMTFLVGRFDVFVLAALVGSSLVGVYGVAKRWASAVVEAVTKLAESVLLPLYSRVAEYDTRSLRRRTFKVRAVVLAVSLPPLWFLAIVGPYLLRIYGAEFAEAQWMVQLLAAGAVMTVISQTIEPVLLSLGDSFRHMLQLAIRFTLQFAGLLVGYHFGQVKGLIIGLAAADLLGYPVLAGLVRKYNVWLPSLDLAAAAVSALVIGLGWYFV